MDQQSMLLQDMNPSRRPKPPSENHPPPPPQKCPRCDSLNTKFCYYNNYSLSQPRYFCKGCRRYWTHGGTLRNVPVGGGCRKGKRARSSPSPSTVSSPSAAAMTSSLHQQQQQQVMPQTLIPSFEQTQRDSRGNLGIPSSSSSSSSSPYFPAGGFLSSLAAMNMRSLSPLMMTQPQIHHHQIGIGGQGFNTNNINIPNLPQNQPINDNFSQILGNERDPSNMEPPMFVHQQPPPPPPTNRGLVPPWALSNHQIGNPSFWNSNNRNTGSNNTSLTPNQWLNLPGCGSGSGPDSSSSMIDKKP